MTIRRIYNEVYNTVMTALIFLAMAILIQKLLLPNLDPWVGVLYCSPCFLAYFAGRVMHGKKLIYALPVGVVVTLLLSAFPVKLTWEISMSAIVACIAIPILTFVLYNLPYVSGMALMGSPRFIGGMALFVANLLIKGAHNDAYAQFLNNAAILFLIVGLFTFNRENLKDAAKQDDNGERMFFPPGLRRNNIVMLSGIILAAFGIANINSLRNAAISVKNFFIRVFVAIMEFIVRLTGRGDDLTGAEGASGDFTGLGDLPSKQNPFMEKLVDILTHVVLVIVILLLLYLIIRALKQLFKKLPGWLQRILDMMRAEREESYVDETEDLLGKGGLKNEIAKNLTDLWDRVTYRTPKFDDMPDNRAKVRFVYKNLLKKMYEDRHDVVNKTPTELTPEADELARMQTADFMDAYNRARYSKGDVPDQDANVAKQLYKKL